MPRRARQAPIDPKSIHPDLSIGGVYRFSYGKNRIRTARLEGVTLAGELVVRIFDGKVWREETIKIRPHDVEPTTPAILPPSVEDLRQLAADFLASNPLTSDQDSNRYVALLQRAQRYETALALQH